MSLFVWKKSYTAGDPILWGEGFLTKDIPQAGGDGSLAKKGGLKALRKIGLFWGGLKRSFFRSKKR